MAFLVDSMVNALEDHFGDVFASRFKSLMDMSGIVEELDSLPVMKQTEMVNNYWRDALATKPFTQSVRCYLIDTGDVDEYIHTFKNHWAEALVNNLLIRGD